jgi:hypothetical protein
MLGRLQTLPAQPMLRRGEVRDCVVEAAGPAESVRRLRRHHPVAGPARGIGAEAVDLLRRAQWAPAIVILRGQRAQRPPPGDSPGRARSARTGWASATGPRASPQKPGSRGPRSCRAAYHKLPRLKLIDQRQSAATTQELWDQTRRGAAPARHRHHVHADAQRCAGVDASPSLRAARSTEPHRVILAVADATGTHRPSHISGAPRFRDCQRNGRSASLGQI